MVSRPIAFGEIPGIKEGKWFKGRKEMMPTSFHRNWGKGIDGNQAEGASAIVLSGGYEDDEDLGDEIIYTGAGGREQNTRKQIADQTWSNSDNAGIFTSWDRGLPIRVIRGHQHKSKFSPETGYTYAGVYNVVDAWQETGKSGFKICRFRLLYCGGDREQMESIEKTLSDQKGSKKRVESTVLRLVRDTKIANEVKNLYKFRCQVCDLAIQTKTGFYAEGAHIKPVGRPHNGDDSSSNLLCLCPNHHVMFDKGMFSITDRFSLVGFVTGNLIVNAPHSISSANLKYHRQIHGYG
jgi:putative restriction endonuclease